MWVGVDSVMDDMVGHPKHSRASLDSGVLLTAYISGVGSRIATLCPDRGWWFSRIANSLGFPLAISSALGNKSISEKHITNPLQPQAFPPANSPFSGGCGVLRVPLL
jgi:hypothetical protein